MNSASTRHSSSSRSRARLRICASLLLLLVFLYSTTGCALVDELKRMIGIGESTIDSSLRILDNGIARLDNESADWQSVLMDMQEQLTNDAQSTLRTEVTQLMERTTASVGTEARCTLDMTRIRVQQGLIRLRADLLGQSVPRPEPYICSLVPTAVDMSLSPDRRPLIELYGFDLTREGMQVWLEQEGGSIDVTDALDAPSHYLLTLNLGDDGIRLDGESRKIRIEWNNQDLYTIGILQPQTPVCEIKPDEKQTPMTIGQLLTPTAGDMLFGDTHIWVYVELQHDGSAIRAYYRWYAEETSKTGTITDPTISEGSQEKEIILPPAGWAIYSINSPLTDHFDEYLYSDLDAHDLNGGGPVSIFSLTSDPGSADPGRTIKTNIQVSLKFSEIHYALIQTGNCIDPNAVVGAAGNSQLSVATIERMVVDVPMRYWDQLPPDQRAMIEPYFIRKISTSVPTTEPTVLPTSASESDFQMAPTSTPASSSIFGVVPSSTPGP